MFLTFTFRFYSTPGLIIKAWTCDAPHRVFLDDTLEALSAAVIVSFPSIDFDVGLILSDINNRTDPIHLSSHLQMIHSSGQRRVQISSSKSSIFSDLICMKGQNINTKPSLNKQPRTCGRGRGLCVNNVRPKSPQIVCLCSEDPTHLGNSEGYLLVI